MSDTQTRTAEEVEKLKEKADDFEARARREGLLPPSEDDDGVGSQTGAVP